MLLAPKHTTSVKAAQLLSSISRYSPDLTFTDVARCLTVIIASRVVERRSRAQTWYLMLKDLETLRNLAKQHGNKDEDEGEEGGEEEGEEGEEEEVDGSRSSPLVSPIEQPRGEQQQRQQQEYKTPSPIAKAGDSRPHTRAGSLSVPDFGSGNTTNKNTTANSLFFNSDGYSSPENLKYDLRHTRTISSSSGDGGDSGDSGVANDHKGVGDSGANEASSLSKLGGKGEQKQPSTLEVMEENWQGRDDDDEGSSVDTIECAARHMEDEQSMLSTTDMEVCFHLLPKRRGWHLFNPGFPRPSSTAPRVLTDSLGLGPSHGADHIGCAASPPAPG